MIKYILMLSLVWPLMLMSEESVPRYLYKVLSVENWKASQATPALQLSEEDRDFIHLAKEDQLERIISKYWANVPEYVILKLDPSKLPGRLVYEANPGGSNKYYHLYEGSIPRQAVIDAKVVRIN